jgi:hypothetical protein
MRTGMAIGLVLAIIGVILLGYQGVTWVTTRDTVVQAGPVQVNVDRAHPVPLIPIVGGVCLAVGILLMVSNAGKRAT